MIGELFHVLVLSDGGVEAHTAAVLDFEDGVEAVEEGLEVNVFAVFNNPCNACSLRLVVILDKTFTNDQSVLLFFSVGLLADPDVDMLVQLKDEGVVCIKVLSFQRSLGDLATLDFASFV